MALRIKNSQTILFIGDSITDCGRTTEPRALGNGYVRLFADMVAVREPAKRITVINKGVGGDTAPGLQERWGDDVLRHKPDGLSIMIGINDLCRFLTQNPLAVTPEKYRSAYEVILSRTKEALPNCRILLIGPFYISTETSSQSIRRRVLELLPQYAGTVRALSKEYKTDLVEMHKLFMKLLKHHDPATFCGEPVHPNITGHLAIADAVYEALSDR